jgi:hypothetical protein
VLIVGPGDLGSRISEAMAERGLASEIKLASRGETAEQWTRGPATSCDAGEKLAVCVRLSVAGARDAALVAVDAIAAATTSAEAGHGVELRHRSGTVLCQHGLRAASCRVFHKWD